MHIVYEENDATSGISSNISRKKGGWKQAGGVQMGKYTGRAKC